MSDDIDYNKLPDYMRSLTGNPDLTIDSEGIHTRTWTSERIAAEQLTRTYEAKAMKVSIQDAKTGISTEVTGLFNAEWSIDKSRLSKPLYSWPATEYTLTAKMELTDHGRTFFDKWVGDYRTSLKQRHGVDDETLDRASELADNMTAAGIDTDIETVLRLSSNWTIGSVVNELVRRHLGRKLLVWADKYGHSFIYKPHGSRRAARRRLSRRRRK